MLLYYGGVMVTMINRLVRLLLHQLLILKMKWEYLPLALRKDRIQ